MMQGPGFVPYSPLKTLEIMRISKALWGRITLSEISMIVGSVISCGETPDKDNIDNKARDKHGDNTTMVAIMMVDGWNG